MSKLVHLPQAAREWLAEMLHQEYMRQPAGSAEERRALQLCRLVGAGDTDVSVPDHIARDWHDNAPKLWDVSEAP